MEIFNLSVLDLLRNFNRSKTLSNMQPIINLGVEFKEIRGGVWSKLNKLDFDDKHNGIPLYDDNFRINGVGIFKIK